MAKIDEDRPVRFGEFVLDPREAMLVGPAGPVRIGRKAFRLLAALVARPAHLLTKEALFETVWDGTVVTESALTATVKELRRALGDEARNARFIENVYGRGYRFVAPVTPVESQISPAVAAPATRPEPDPPTGSAEARRRPAPSRRALLGWGGVALATAAAGMIVGLARQRAGPPAEVETLVGRARQLMDSNLTVGQNEAIGLLRRAVDLAPDYADGWGLLGLAYAIPSHFRERGEGLMLRGRARAAADRALELDPGNGLGELARAVELPFIGHWTERDRSLDRAIADRPGDGDILSFVGLILQFAGRASVAPPWFERIGPRPLTPGTFSDYIHALWSAGRIDEAERAAMNATTLYPTQQTLWYDRYRIMMASGRADAAVALLKDSTARPLNVDDAFLDDLLAHADAVRRPGTPQARRTLERALSQARTGDFEAQAAIRLAGLLGDRDAGFAVTDAFYFSRGFLVPDNQRWGQVASLEQRDPRLLFEPEVASLRADPRFERLVEDIGLDRYWHRRGVVPDYRRERTRRA